MLYRRTAKLTEANSILQLLMKYVKKIVFLKLSAGQCELFPSQPLSGLIRFLKKKCFFPSMHNEPVELTAIGCGEGHEQREFSKGEWTISYRWRGPLTMMAGWLSVSDYQLLGGGLALSCLRIFPGRSGCPHGPALAWFNRALSSEVLMHARFTLPISVSSAGLGSFLCPRSLCPSQEMPGD